MSNPNQPQLTPTNYLYSHKNAREYTQFQSKYPTVKPIQWRDVKTKGIVAFQLK